MTVTEINMPRLLFTIAVPTYNNAKTLGRTIESCLRQTDLTETEILVVNNASTDATSEVITSYSNHGALRCLNNEKTVTMYENHNVCLQNARGRYVLFCHSDDELDPDAIAILKVHLQSRDYPKRYICWGHSLLFDYSAILTRHGYQTGQLFAGERAAIPFLAGGLTPSGTCYSCDILEYGGFIKSTHRLAASDSSTMVYLALKGFRFEMIQQLIFFRTDASTVVNGIPIKEHLNAYCDTYSNLRNQLDGPAFEKLISLVRSSPYPPFLFLYFIASSYPKIVLSRIVRHIATKPWVLMDQLSQLILWKAIAARWAK